MRLGIAGPLVVDPAAASLASPSDLMVLDLLYDGLTRLDAAGVPQPALATEWDANDELTAFQFQLDPAATFSSGRAVTPDDVIASLERVIAAGDSSLAALSLEAVKGFGAFADGDAEHVSGLTSPSAGTVRVELTTPLSVLPSILSSPVLSVVDPATVEGDLGDVDLSGAWTVASTEDGDLVLDNRSEDGSVETIELLAYDDEDAAFAAFEDGDVDWAQVPASSYEQAVEEYGDDAFAPFQAELFFGMNVATPALSVQAVREAIMLAIDRDAIVEAVYPDLADTLATVVPAGVPGHDPDRCPACTPDPDRAADIISFCVPRTGPCPRCTSTSTRRPPRGDGGPRGRQPRGRRHPHRAAAPAARRVRGIRRVGRPGALQLRVDRRLRVARCLPRSAVRVVGQRQPHRLPSDAHVDALLEDARASTSTAENARRWARAEEEILEAAVVVPIAQFRIQVVVADRVEGLQTAVDGTVDWAQVSLTG